MKTGIIYKATSPNKKVYIGCTTYSLEYRKYKHSNRAYCEKDPHFKTKFARAIRKYGAENFIWETLAVNIPVKNLEKIESEFIKEFDSVKSGYNILESSIANYNRGRAMSQEQKEKLRQANLGKKYSEESRIKRSISLKKAYAEGRRVVSPYATETIKRFNLKPRSIEFREKLSASKKGKPAWNKGLSGKPWTEERRIYMSNLNKGKKLSEEHKRKIGIANKLAYSMK